MKSTSGVMKPLAGIATVIMGQSPPGATYNDRGEGLPLLNGPTEFGPTYPQCTLFTNDSRRECEPGDLIFCVRGSTTGRMNWANRKFSLGRGVCAIRSKSILENRLIRYCIQLQLHALLNFAGGGTFPNLTKDTIENFEIPWPENRKQIAAILSAYDDLIENNLRRIRILEEMARSLYRDWFVEFRFPGHTKVPRIASALGSIPKGWTASTLSTLVDTQYGYTESTNNDCVGPKYLRGMDINKTSYIDWADVPYCPIAPEDLPRYKLRKGDIVVIRMADPGKVGIVEQEVDAVFASYLIRITPKDRRLGSYFLFHLLDSRPYQNYIGGASTGTTRKSASAGVVTSFDFLLPPEELVALFERRAAPTRQLLTNLLQENANLRRTRDLLLPRLLSGASIREEVAA